MCPIGKERYWKLLEKKLFMWRREASTGGRKIDMSLIELTSSGCKTSVGEKEAPSGAYVI